MVYGSVSSVEVILMIRHLMRYSFTEAGFRVEALAVREPGSGKPIDRVNM